MYTIGRLKPEQALRIAFLSDSTSCVASIWFVFIERLASIGICGFCCLNLCKHNYRPISNPRFLGVIRLLPQVEFGS